MVRALAARVDELVVLCDSAVPAAVPANARVREFGARDAGGARRAVRRGARARAAAAPDRRRRAHGPALRGARGAARAAAARSRSCSGTRTGRATPSCAPPRRCRTAVVSVDERSFPLPSRKVHAIGHGIDVGEFACTDAARRRAAARARARPLLAGEGARDDPARRRARRRRTSRLHGSDETLRGSTSAGSRAIAGAPSSAGPVPRARCPALFARSHVLINNMRAGAPDKVVYEAAASCLPVLASNPVFDDLLPAGAALRPRRPREPRRAAAHARPPAPARAARARRRATTPSSTGPTACSLPLSAR